MSKKKKTTPVSEVNAVRQRLRELVDDEYVTGTKRYFKTGAGEYSEGDIFIGVRVPDQRKVAQEYADLSAEDLTDLLQSEIHEERHLALLIMVGQFQRGNKTTRKAIYDLYIEQIACVNNWDLVDTSAAKIVGAWLKDRSRKPLRTYAQSADLWERRIAIVATHHFIQQDDFEETLHIAELLLDDEEDLIHKAVGWMLRELGKRDEAVLEAFLQSHYEQLPRTTLRYAIERFDEERRQDYLQGRMTSN